MQPPMLTIEVPQAFFANTAIRNHFVGLDELLISTLDTPRLQIYVEQSLIRLGLYGLT
jgi:hypothetical protein